MTEPTTLATSVLPGAGYVHLDRQVPVPCIITLSPDTPSQEKVPLYKCTDDDGPFIAWLGVDNPHGPAFTVALKHAHGADSTVRVEVVDGMQPEGEVWKTAPSLAQQIRDRLDSLDPERGITVEFPAPTTRERMERFRKAYLDAQSLPWLLQGVDGPKVYPGFEMLRDAVLAVLSLDQQFRTFGPISLPDTDDGRRRFYMHAGAQEGLELAMTAIADALGIEADDA